MIEIYPNLFVGSLNDYNNLTNKEQWKVVQACKEPCHRDALGYKSRGAPLNHPERMVAYRDNKLILNLVDSNNFTNLPQNINDDITSTIETAIKFINEHIENYKVLVHCNLGMSRSPSIALLYLKKHTNTFEKNVDYEQARNYFKTTLYQNYSPNQSMIEVIKELWE